jgi:hypothetical protein
MQHGREWTPHADMRADLATVISAARPDSTRISSRILSDIFNYGSQCTLQLACEETT